VKDRYGGRHGDGGPAIRVPRGKRDRNGIQHGKLRVDPDQVVGCENEDASEEPPAGVDTSNRK